MVGGLGIEPSMPEATDLQSAEVTNASHRPLISLIKPYTLQHYSE